MSLWDWWNSLLLQGSPSAPSARRLDGRSKTLLAASIKALITNKEAKQLFSSMDDDCAFGEMDEVGKGNIADFASHVTPRCSFEFMPVEGLLHAESGRRPMIAAGRPLGSCAWSSRERK
jgi:hypothetical protein